ncbi:hypothetical protein AVO42_00505 [Thiomicrospira sp. XS5]|nr:hypothetical protein AVO42_00505 [Thiomicrospira sp. XS5]
MADGQIKYPYTLAQLKNDEGLSFPATGIPGVLLTDYNVHPVYALNRPEEKVSPLYVVKRHPPALAEDGKYYEEYYIEPAEIPPLLDLAGDVVETSDQRKLKFAKAFQIDKVRAAYAVDAVAPVTDTNGIEWRGGEASAQAIKGAAELAEFAGQTTITLRDAARAAHIVSIADAKAVAAQIGGDYQTKFQVKEQAIYDIERAETVPEIESINY